MAASQTELKSLLSQEWENCLQDMNFCAVMEYRSSHIRNFDGVMMPPLYQWPKDIRQILFKTSIPLSHKETCKLFIFLIGNGYSPFRIGIWILTYFALCDWGKRVHAVRTRIDTMIGIYGTLLSEEKLHYYWDVRDKASVKMTDSKHSYLSKHRLM